MPGVDVQPVFGRERRDDCIAAVIVATSELGSGIARKAHHNA
jgi:hypothetical protein